MEKTKSFNEIIEIIKSNEDVLRKFLKEDDVNKIYETFKQYGYSGTIEDIQNEILSKLHSDSILSEEQLNDIAGGKMNFKKGISGAMSALALMGTVMPSTGATTTNKAQLDKAPSSNEGGTLQKIKHWGSQGVEKAKETSAILANKAKELYGKASENKLVKYGLGAVLVIGTGYGGYRLLFGGKPVEAYTEKGAELIAAAMALFDYTLNNYSKLYNSNGELIESTSEKIKADALARQLKTKWDEFAKTYFKNLTPTKNSTGFIVFLKNQLKGMNDSETPEGRDCQTLLNAINKFESEMKAAKTRKGTAKKVGEEAAEKAREKAERKAREEAERKAKEEAERKEAERKEAERKAKEEAERKAKEEAERKEAERKEAEKTERSNKINSIKSSITGIKGKISSYNKTDKLHRKKVEFLRNASNVLDKANQTLDLLQTNLDSIKNNLFTGYLSQINGSVEKIDNSVSNAMKAKTDRAVQNALTDYSKGIGNASETIDKVSKSINEMLQKQA